LYAVPQYSSGFFSIVVRTWLSASRTIRHLMEVRMKMTMRQGVRACAVLGVMVTPAALTAAPQQAAEATRGATVSELSGQVGASTNNAGAQLSFEVSRQRPLSTSRHPLLSEAHVGFGETVAFTPAHVRAGVWVEAAPLSVFVVRAGAQPAYYFGSFNSLTSFDSRRDAFDTDSVRERDSATSGSAVRAYVTPTLRLRVRRFIGLASADLEWWSSNAAGPLFYEPTRDTLLDVSGDRLTTLTSAILYEHPLATGLLTTGLTHSRMQVGGRSLNEVQKLGAVVVRQFGGRVLSLNRPSVTVTAARYLKDPSKQGEWTASAAIGFSLHR
jgi:hypothetical protein